MQLVFRLNFLGHSSQEIGFTSVWHIRWAFNFLFEVKKEAQNLHDNLHDLLSLCVSSSSAIIKINVT